MPIATASTLEDEDVEMPSSEVILQAVLKSPALRRTIVRDPIFQDCIFHDLLSKLRNNEEKWRDRHEMLEKEGYILRPRLRPGWKPSWLQSGKSPLKCEDGEPLPERPDLVDATEKESGKLVYIKEVTTDCEEHRIAQLLTREDWINDPRNHCVPIIKIFQDNNDPRVSYIVMPFLRPADDPPFETVKEVIDYVDQMLEGLVFLHEKGIAHRDCVMRNILLDADTMYPGGFHPLDLNKTPDYSSVAKYISRTSAGAKYYYVDFGISVYIPDDMGTKLVTGVFGRDRDPPELSLEKPYDPFKLDIFIVGNMFKKEFCDKYTNFEFLRPLTEGMTKNPARERPTAEATLREWSEIRGKVSILHREWQLRPSGEPFLITFVLDVSFCYRRLIHLAKACVRGVLGTVDRIFSTLLGK